MGKLTKYERKYGYLWALHMVSLRLDGNIVSDVISLLFISLSHRTTPTG